jgi:uncharacterized protein
MSYKTPGVYVEEISKFPPSVAEVETAIPAFIGYTAKGIQNVPTRITSLLDYETLFGAACPEKDAISIDVTDGVVTATVTSANVNDYKMYYALQMYFANGGGPCYIVSVGTYNTTVGATQVAFSALKGGLDLLVKEDEPTLIVFPDAAGLPATGTNNVHSLYDLALAQAEKLGDRFVIMDVISTVDTFRDTLGTSALKYGAAYYPNLETTLSYSFTDTDVAVDGVDDVETLAELKESNSALYNQALKAIAAKSVVLAPSSAIAGVYARVDNTSGVWKAPANVSLNYVVAPTEKISHDDQEALNVDDTAGKSVNAIRSFIGKGTLVWGARTLDGNSNEWRYVSVRRFFNMVEESVKKSTERFVFESNDAKTWIRIKSMIENYLNQLWMSGALAGSTPEQAYYVSVGLNQTMSAQDILEGRLVIEVGMAAVRPAEFIVLRFSHKAQEA